MADKSREDRQSVSDQNTDSERQKWWLSGQGGFREADSEKQRKSFRYVKSDEARIFT